MFSQWDIEITQKVQETRFLAVKIHFFQPPKRTHCIFALFKIYYSRKLYCFRYKQTLSKQNKKAMDRSLPYFESVTASSIFKSFVLTTSDVESKEVRSLRNDELFNEKVHMARCCALVMDDRVSGFRRCLNAAFHGSTVIEATGKRRMRYCRTHNIKHAECVTLYHKYTKQTNEGVDLKVC